MEAHSILVSQKFREDRESHDPEGWLYSYEIILKSTSQVTRWKVRFDLAADAVFEADWSLYGTEGGTAYIESSGQDDHILEADAEKSIGVRVLYKDKDKVHETLQNLLADVVADDEISDEADSDATREGIPRVPRVPRVPEVPRVPDVPFFE